MSQKVSAYILSGGKSSRMGSDKGLMPVFDKLMVQHLIDKFRFMGIPVSLIANNEEYKQFGIPAYADIYADKGPIGGIYTALNVSDADSCLIISCDTPFITVEHLSALLSRVGENKPVISVHNGHMEPLIGLYPKVFSAELESAISTNRLKLIALLEECGFGQLEREAAYQEFANLNTLADMEAIGKQIPIRFFGMVAERLGKQEDLIEIRQSDEGRDLREWLNTQYPQISNMSFQVAVDHQISETIPQGKSISEIAVLPPFAGG